MVRPLLVALVALGAASSGGATTYIPLSFDELVSRAQMIFVGEVADVRPFELNTSNGRLIKTRVVFRVLDPVFGTASTIEVFEFLGGEIGNVGLVVEGMPHFAIGDRRIIFARRDRSLNPIVGFTQGILQIRRDGNGIDRVLTIDGMPVVGAETFGLRTPFLGRAPLQPMRLSDFRSQILRGLGARAR